MKKQQVLDKLETRWSELQESFAGLSPAELLEPGVTGDWSVKDILAHVSWWEAEALKHLPHILKGERPPRYKDLYGGIDAFNALMTAQKRLLTLEEVLSELAETHHRLLETVQNAPEELFTTETRYRHRLRLDTYSHYPEHTQAIWEWRSRRDQPR